MKAGIIEKGTVLLIKLHPYLVLEREFFTPGKGAAVVRCKVRNLITNQVLRETFKTAEQVETADIEDRDCQFLYAEGKDYIFMETVNYEQFTVSGSLLGTRQYYLEAGMSYRLVFWQEQVIDIIIPPKVTLVVKDAPEALKGDTVGSTTKKIVCETGLVLKAPLFIKEQDKIVVNSDTGEYVERVSE